MVLFVKINAVGLLKILFPVCIHVSVQKWGLRVEARGRV